MERIRRRGGTAPCGVAVVSPLDHLPWIRTKAVGAWASGPTLADVTSSSPGPARRVLGIDPGTRVLGWGVVEEGDARRLVALGHGTWRANTKAPVPQRLAHLCAALEEAIDAWAPSVVAIEEAFHGRDASAALRIGEARGALMATAARRGLDVHGYANNVVKQAVTGRGRASKDQVQAMVMRILGLPEPPDTADASDALAVAICHLQRAAAGPGRTSGRSSGLAPSLQEALRREGIDPSRALRRRR